MCGIIGYVGDQPAMPIIIQGLRDLEYRGYDSAGIAILEPSEAGMSLVVTKREGRVARLESALAEAPPLGGTAGIGHTRWATHGEPSDRNAHPHAAGASDVVVVHNGIVENYATLQSGLTGDGVAFQSDTDTETIAHLLHIEIERGLSLQEALRVVSDRLDGSQAIVAMSLRQPGVIAAARLGNAGGIVVGIGDGEHFVASDLAALLPHTRKVVFLADGEFVTVQSDSVEVRTKEGRLVDFQVREVPLDPQVALKAGHEHYMMKEILEQPETLADTVQSLATALPPSLRLHDLEPILPHLANVRKVVLIGMGTSLHAAMIGRDYIEQIAGIQAEFENASEFRQRRQLDPEGTLVVSVSQSGETVDVLEAMAVAKAAGSRLVTICNVEGAQSTRVADGTVYIRAGLERSVASTKCYTGAIAALYGLALVLAQQKGSIQLLDLASRLQDFLHLPAVVAGQLRDLEPYRELAGMFRETSSMLFLGRGLGFPTAMEGALKMKEVSYVHAEGYAAGEMKHGPISLVEPSFPTIAVATQHAQRSKMISNIRQVQARGGEVIGIITKGDTYLREIVPQSIEVPDVAAEFEPIVATVPLQLLAYFVALERGCDVDQPRNLAKTVTVE